MATRVDLRAGVGVGGVQGDGLVAHEVVPGLEAGRHRVGGYAAGFHDLAGAPSVRRAFAAFFFDFEPDGTVYISRLLVE